MSKIKEISLLRLPSPTEGFLALNSGRADAYVIAQSSAKRIFEKQGAENFNSTEIEGTGETYALAISKEYAQLLDPIQDALNFMEKDGTINELKKKWKL